MPDPTRRHSRSSIVTLLVIVRNAYFNSSPGPASPFNGDKAILEIRIATQICRRAGRRYDIHRSTNNSSSGNDIVLRKTMDSRGGLAISGVRDFRSRIPYLRCGSCWRAPPVQIASNSLAESHYKSSRLNRESSRSDSSTNAYHNPSREQNDKRDRSKE